MKRVWLLIVCLALLSSTQTIFAAANVFAWGDNTHGQCDVPADLTNAIAIAAGDGFSMALRPDGTLVQWGAVAATPPGLTNVVSISACGQQRMVVKADGTISVWPCGPIYPPVPASNVVQLAGAENGLVVELLTDGRMTLLQCPVVFCNLYDITCSNLVAVACDVGAKSFYGLTSDGAVVTSGGCPPTRTYPLIPDDLTNATAIAADDQGGVLFLRLDSTIGGGHLVHYTLGSTIYFPVTNYDNVVSIAGGFGGFLAVRRDGIVVVPSGTLTVPSDLPFTISAAVGKGHCLAIVNPGVPGAPPSIARQPLASQTVPVNGFALISASARGYPPLGYQWFFNGSNSLGDNFPSLRLTNVQPAQSGVYTVVVTNVVGSVTSAPSLLNVAPVLNVQAAPVIYMTGGIGVTYRLEYINQVGPTNAWTVLDTVLITNQSQIYVDFGAIGKPARYYRMVQVP